jgi:hypothetical protein
MPILHYYAPVLCDTVLSRLQYRAEFILDDDISKKNLVDFVTFSGKNRERYVCTYIRL